MAIFNSHRKAFRMWRHHFLLGWRRRISLFWAKQRNQPTPDVDEAIRQRLLTDLEASESVSLAPTWKKFCGQIEQSVRTKDVARFLEWPEIIRPMFVGWSGFGLWELLFLRAHKDWKNRWSKILPEDSLGAPAPYWCFPNSSGNRIHHVYHLAQFEKATGREISSFERVVEFGGGYGSLCHLIHRLGFKGEYIIHDLPPLTALQRFYLSELGHRVDPDQGVGVYLSSSWEVLDQLLAGEAKSTLFVATWSLSEAPPEVRQAMLGRLLQLQGLQGFLLAYQENFDGWDNMSFFKDLPLHFADMTWYGREINVLPGHHYLFAA